MPNRCSRFSSPDRLQGFSGISGRARVLVWVGMTLVATGCYQQRYQPVDWASRENSSTLPARASNPAGDGAGTTLPGSAPAIAAGSGSSGTTLPGYQGPGYQGPSNQGRGVRGTTLPGTTLPAIGQRGTTLPQPGGPVRNRANSGTTLPLGGTTLPVGGTTLPVGPSRLPSIGNGTGSSSGTTLPALQTRGNR